MLRSTIRVMSLVVVLSAASLAAPANANEQQANSNTNVWVGSENLPGYGRLEFRFADGGGVVMIDAREVSVGSFRRSGDTITITFPGRATYTGTIEGSTMWGTARDSNGTWSWSVGYRGQR